MITRVATPVDAPVIARVHVETWRTSYRGIVPDDFLSILSYAPPTEKWAEILGDGENFVYVAEDELARIVGFASGGPERNGDPVYRGELLRLYVLESAQRRGLGRRLVGCVATRLRQAGIHSMLVWTMAEGPSRHFYEALGGRPVRVGQWDFGDLTVDEVAYGWTATCALG